MVRKVPLTVGGGKDPLSDDTIKGVMRSLGDAGAGAVDAAGYTALSLLTSLKARIELPGGAETFTTTPLGIGASYTGSTRDFWTSRVGFMGCLAFADQASAANGFKIQQSIDGTNWDLDSAATSVSASVGAGIKAAIVARYARVSYTNGGVAQTAFRLGGRYTIS